MKIRCRILSLLLAVICLLGLCACNADEPVVIPKGDLSSEVVSTGKNKSYEYNIYSDGTIGITKYTGGYTRHTIPSVVDGYEVSRIEDKAFYQCNLVKVVIPDTVIFIGEQAFCNNYGLKKVELSKNVRYLGEKCFFLDEALKKIEIPASLKAVGGSPFNGTQWLKKQKDEFLIIGDGILLKYNGDQSEVVVPDGVKFISTAFGSLNGEFGKYMAHFEKVVLPDSVTTLGDFAFAECMYLEEIEFSPNITSIGRYCFLDCGALTAIDLPEKVTEIPEYCFYNCYGLTEFTVPDTIEKIAGNAFKSCVGLSSFTIGASVSEYDITALSQCDWLETLKVSEANPYYSAQDLCLYDKNKTKLYFYYPKKTDTFFELPESVEVIGRNAFNNAEALNEVVLLGNLKTIEKDAFKACSQLKYVTFDRSLKEIQYAAFGDCISLAGVYYTGSVAEWSQIGIAASNSIFGNLYIECDFVPEN